MHIFLDREEQPVATSVLICRRKTVSPLASYCSESFTTTTTTTTKEGRSIVHPLLALSSQPTSKFYSKVFRPGSSPIPIHTHTHTHTHTHAHRTSHIASHRIASQTWHTTSTHRPGQAARTTRTGSNSWRPSWNRCEMLSSTISRRRKTKKLA